MNRLVDNPYVKPAAILLGVLIAFLAADYGGGRIWKASTLFSTLETFATGGLVALGLGLTMIAGEFDISVVGIYSLAGCIAVMTGSADPYLGAAIAVACGAVIGTAQGFIITRMRLSSVAVTLGGMLTCNGIASVLTKNQSISYDNIDVSLAIANPLFGPLTIRAVTTFAAFALLAALVAFTRPGRDIVAVGSDRHAAATAGVPVSALLVLIFAFSGACAALSGAMTSYSLASASPSGLSDVVLPAAAGAILGGVSLGGGSGRPLGVMLGVLTLSFLHAGFNAVGAPPFVNDVAMGAILLLVGLLDSPDLARRLTSLRFRLIEKPTDGSV